MPDTIQRLARCFLAVFPDLTEAQVSAASQHSVAGWDSVAHVSLLTLIDEEFGLGLDYEQYEEFDSYASIFAFLNGRASNR